MGSMIVVDASVARASGGHEAIAPVSTNCRDFLLDMRNICHRLVLTPPLLEEWKNHKSRFASTWLTSMFARKKVEIVTNTERPALRAKIDGNAKSEKELRIVRKDVHLLEAALGTDSIVASLDDEACRLFGRICNDGVGEISPIVWVNPAADPDGTKEWLTAGAPVERHRQLCNIE
jgi:hypothetical protein